MHRSRRPARRRRTYDRRYPAFKTPTPALLLHSRHDQSTPSLLHAMPPGFENPGPATMAPALCGRFVWAFPTRPEIYEGGFLTSVAGWRRYRGHLDEIVCRRCRKRARLLQNPRWRHTPPPARSAA